MVDDHFTALFLYDDDTRRARVRTMLTERGISNRGRADLRSWTASDGETDIDCVVVQLPSAGARPTTGTITDLRRRMPNTQVIVLTPIGDLAATRDSFRAGAWDCLEDSVGDRELVERISEALRTRRRRQALSTTSDLGRNHKAVSLSEHSAFLDGLACLRSLCRRRGEPLSIMMLDIDRFRACNEKYSPAFGDRVLKRFATIVKSVLREGDLIARYEGDRFIAALPNATATRAAQLVRRCRWAVGVQPMTEDGTTHEITFSAGFAESSVGFVESEHQLIERATAALDDAKQQGTGRTVSWRDLLDATSSRRVSNDGAPEDVSRWAQRLRQHLRSTYVESTMALVAAVEAKDPCTQSHSLTVADYAEAIGKRMQLSSRMVETVRAAALLHDIGKIGVPDAILTKPGPLTAEEFTIVKRHPQTALEILGHVSFLTDVTPLILHHHERFDGSGYPAGLIGDQIPIGARILAVADALDTMFSMRSYKKPYTTDQVTSQLKAGAGKQFDERVVECALEIISEAPHDSRPTSSVRPLWRT